MQIDLNALANIGEFVAAIGVIVTLVYLAAQVRQNTASDSRNPMSSASTS